MQRYRRCHGLLVKDPAGPWVYHEDTQEEIIKLQAIVDKIPKLADGEPAILGEKVFVRWNNSRPIECCTITGIQGWINGSYTLTGRSNRTDTQIVSNLSYVYKTREAAEQAGITDQEARKELTAAIHDALPSYQDDDTREMHRLRFTVDKYGLTE